MGLVGVPLGIAVALLWGSADSIATLAARNLGALRTTFISQAAGLIVLTALDAFVPTFWPSFPPSTFRTALLLGAWSGLCGAVGYFAFYKALMVGPVALVSPLSSTSAVVTLILSLLLLHDSVAPAQVIAIGAILLGVMFASTNLREAHLSLKKRAIAPTRSGALGYALIATVAFGAMDFGIGASARVAGFFLPVLFTRTFSLLFLTGLTCWIQYQARPRCCYRGARAWRQYALLQDTGVLAAPPLPAGLLLAILAGIVENAAVLLFSADTRIATTGVSAAIASNYAVVAALVGFFAFRERLVANQVFGIGLVLGGLSLLTLAPT
jgi:drug/metabolite transporter (DMT)-like permease